MSADKPRKPRRAGAPRCPAPPRLKLVHSAPERPPAPEPDPEARRLLADVNRRGRARRARDDNDEPEAA
jgi:hypothetical protein